MKLSSLAAMVFGDAPLPFENAVRPIGGAPAQSRSGHTGIPAARRVKRKQRNIAAKR